MYGIGIVGLGLMGQRMAGEFAEHGSFHIVAAFDPSPRSDLVIAHRSEAASVIRDPDVDCVYIAAPPAAHLALIREATAAGKAIFCEKPLASSIAEARACIKAVERAQRPTFVNFPFATAPAAVRLGNLLKSGDLGEVQEARLTMRFKQWPRPWQEQAASWLTSKDQGGFMREVGSHFLFLAARLFGSGRILEKSILCHEHGAPTRVCATLEYGTLRLAIEGAIAGEVDDDNRFELIGSKASAALTDWYRLDYDGVLEERTPPTQTQLDGLAAALSGRQLSAPLASFAEAAQVVELVEGILNLNKP